jgi:putative flippase GtrA
LTFVRYTLTGGVATAVHYALLVTLVEGLHLGAAWAAALGALAGAVVAYFGNRRFTFPHSRARHGHAVPRFGLVAGAAAALSASIVWLGSTVLGAHYLLSQAVATATGLVLGYSFNRHWTFG